MNVVKCVNGHFFDYDKYDICPHCGAQTVQEEEARRQQKPSHRDSRGSSGARRDTRASRGNAARRDTRQGLHHEAPAAVPKPEAAPSVWKGQEKEPASKPENPSIGVTTASITIGDFLQDNPDDLLDAILNKSDEQDGKDAASEVFPEGTLKRELQSASASSEQKTLGYYNRLHGAGDGARAAADPVTGWLVCIAGPHFGESFPVFSGNNSIGRGEDNRIVLSRDRSVSNHKHALIIYEPRQRKFFVQPGESSGLTYLNDAFITALSELKARAVLELGTSKFLFVPLCGEDFSWEEYLDRS